MPTTQATYQSDGEIHAFPLKDDKYLTTAFTSMGIEKIEHDTRIDNSTDSIGDS